MFPRRSRSRSLTGFAVAAVLTLALGAVGAGPALSAAAAPAEEPVSPAAARIVTVDTTVRAEPSHGADAVVSLSAGAKVSVTAKVPSWRKVTVSGSEGWVPYSVTQKVPKDLGKRTARELNRDVTLRAQPGAKAVAVASVLKHSYVVAIDVAGSWRKIETARGTGWVPASAISSVSLTSRSSAATKVLNVRASASGATDVVLVLEKGQKVKVLGTRGTWSSVKWGSHNAPAATHSGWTSTKNLISSNIRETKTALNLRTRPWTGKVVTVIPKGALVTMTGSKTTSYTRTPRTWYRVSYGSHSGWVAATYLKAPY